MSHFIFEKWNHGLSEQELRRAMLESPELKCGKGDHSMNIQIYPLDKVIFDNIAICLFLFGKEAVRSERLLRVGSLLPFFPSQERKAPGRDRKSDYEATQDNRMLFKADNLILNL